MQSKTSPAASMFEKVLRAFETRGITYSDVLGQLRRLLAAGAPSTELLAILRRRASTKQMPEYARLEALLLAAMEQGAALNEGPDPVAARSAEPAPADARGSAASMSMPNPSSGTPAFEPRPPDDEVSVDLDFDAFGKESTSPKALRASELDLSLLTKHLRSADERNPTRVAALEALTRSYERAREGESAAAERANALAAELAAARTDLQAEQSRVQDIGEALSESVAAGEAARAEALRESQHYQTELRTLRESLAESAGVVDQTRRALEERDARIAALSQERTIMETALEARANAAAALEADSHAARAHAEAATLELKMRQAEAAAASKALDERDARISALCRERTNLQAALEDREKAAKKLEADARAARAHAEAATSELRTKQANAAAAFDKQLKRGESRLDAIRNKLDAANKQSILYLELLRTREWRRGFDQSPFQPDARSEPADATRAAPRVTREEPRAQPELTPSPPDRPRAGRLAGPGRAIGWGALAVLLVGFAWLIVHRFSAPQPPRASAAVPNQGAVIRDCPKCPAMTVLPVGVFKQGSADASAFEQPLHRVMIRHPIAMSTNPVTLEDFGQFAAATGRQMQGCDTYDGEWKQQPDDSWERPGFAQAGTHPVTCVSWNDAEAYAQWLSARTGHRYRLPSASEWEFAARAGVETAPPWGSDSASACANANVADASAERRYPGWTVFPCDDGYVYTAPVGVFKANAFGLNDMLGNVLQWTEDCWNDNYVGAPIDGSARTDGNCSLHEVRGGSWFSTPSYVRADYRDRFATNYRTSTVGIRLVRDIQP